MYIYIYIYPRADHLYERSVIAGSLLHHSVLKFKDRLDEILIYNMVIVRDR